MKGKDFMKRNMQYPEEYYRDPQQYYKDYYPPNFWEQSQQQLKAEKLKNKYKDFQRDNPNAYALLDVLFGDAAYRVFKHLKLDGLTEGKCLELLKFLATVEDCDEESREYQAITTPSIDEIA
tara:strand:- start:1275 stop:1640 length:366 start_codon:yes stop_codon:yes gene_type:complete